MLTNQFKYIQSDSLTILREITMLRYAGYYQNIISILGGALTEVAKLVVQAVKLDTVSEWVSDRYQ